MFAAVTSDVPEVGEVGELVEDSKNSLVVPRLKLQTSISCRSPSADRGEHRAATGELGPRTRTLYSSHSGASERMMPAQAVPCP